MKKIAVINNKGGVGKSTIAVNFSHGLTQIGKKVCLIDLDGQNDSSLLLGFHEADYGKTFYELMNDNGTTKVADCLIKARENLDLLPNRNIDKINNLLSQVARIDLHLKRKLADLDDMDYDFVVFDCGPQRTKVNDAVLCYIDHILMPVQLEIASVKAAGNIYAYLDDLGLSPEIIAGVIPNMYDQRTNVAKQNLALLERFFEGRALVTEPIHRRVKITEAGEVGKTVYEYDEEAAIQFTQVLSRVVTEIV